MYYVLESKDQAMISHLCNSADNGFGTSFLKGTEVDVTENNPGLYVEFEKEPVKLLDYFEVDGLPIVSQKFNEAIKSSGSKEYQMIPIELRRKKGITKGYYLLNVIQRLKCIDENATKASRFGPRIMRISDLKLNEELVSGTSMFRADEYQCVIFISEKIKDAIGEIDGCEIRTADGWSDKHRF